MALPSSDDTNKDARLEDIRTNTDKIVACSAEPTTFTEANVTFNIGEITGITSGDFTAISSSGSDRVLTRNQVGPLTGSATTALAAIAYLDVGNSRLIHAAGNTAFAVQSGVDFNLASKIFTETDSAT